MSLTKNNTILNDVFSTADVLDHNCCDNYRSIYFRSNEDIGYLLSNVDVYGKNVLSVLASGDQAFHFYDKGASHVDFFDVNKLTFYYLYIRLWTMRYNKLYYPDMGPLGYISNTYINDLLSNVVPADNNEQAAYDYWKSFLEAFPCEDVEDLFLELNEDSINSLDADKITNIMKNKPINFYNMDISQDIDLNKKYDIIYVSNIVDWLGGDLPVLTKYRDNLYNLLDDEGVVLSSFINGKVDPQEKNLFVEKFCYYPLASLAYRHSPGYVFKKKKL